MPTDAAHVVLAPQDFAIAYLRYPSNVLIPILLGEAQVLVQPKAHIVAV